jgi:hypothetical protein
MKTSIKTFGKLKNRRILYVLCSFYLLGCSSDNLFKIGLEQQRLIISESLNIISENNFEKFKYIDLSNFDAPTISNLNPKKLILRNEGLYIQVQDGFVEESGYFIPKGINNKEAFIEGSDPSYRKITDSLFIYSYQ